MSGECIGGGWAGDEVELGFDFGEERSYVSVGARGKVVIWHVEFLKEDFEFSELVVEGDKGV